MKNIVFAFVVLFSLAFVSCSKCYECKVPVEVQSPDTTYTTFQVEELCTASQKEIDEKESEGYICK